MADTTSNDGKGWRWLLKDAATSLVMDVLYKKFLAAFGKKLEDKLSNDKRGELLRDFRIMKDEGKDPKNLVRRHKKVNNTPQENRFVELLCKLPVDEKTGRREELAYLNDLDDEEFDQMLDLLDHDVAFQWAKYAINHIGEFVGKSTEWMKTEFNKTEDSVHSGFNKADACVSQPLQKLDDWLSTKERR